MFLGRRNSKIGEFYRGKETALWTNLIPKLNQRDINSSDASHELDHSEDMSTFDDPSRLISKFWTIFPTPPPPPYTPPFNPNQMDTSYVSQPSESFESITEEPATYKPPDRQVTPKPDPEQKSPVSKPSTEDNSSVPLSVVIVLGCVFVFINLLIFAGLYYYHKRKSLKYRDNTGNSNGGENVRQFNDTRSTGERNNIRGNTHEVMNLMQTKAEDTAPKKIATINHKPVSNTQYSYTPISKPVVPLQNPGGYNYSVLSQNTASPVHVQKPVQTSSSNPPTREGGATAELGNQTAKESNLNPARHQSGADQTVKTEQTVEPRTKQIVRGNHTVSSSNNAITIV